MIGKLKKCAPILHIFSFFIYIASLRLSRPSAAQYYSESASGVKSEILFLETVPARYYLLAVFQKKHRRHRCWRNLGACFGVLFTYTSMISSLVHPFSSSSSLPPNANVPCATVSSMLDWNKKRRETINLNKNMTASLRIQRPALTA